MKLTEEFQVHDELNPKIWVNNQLIPEVKDKIVEIVTNFEEYVKVPINIVDIQVVGSNASYNYTDTSDLDVHVIVNFDLVNADDEILQVVYDMKKTQFNQNFDISIHGIAVELYIQDIKTTIVSNGIYSVCDDKWISEPKPIKNVKVYNIEKELEKWTEQINTVVASGDYQQVVDTINALYLMRQNSILVDGEYGKGNALFKEIRTQGLLGKLKLAITEAYSRKLSLENYSKGQLINMIND